MIVEMYVLPMPTIPGKVINKPHRGHLHGTQALEHRTLHPETVAHGMWVLRPPVAQVIHPTVTIILPVLLVPPVRPDTVQHPQISHPTLPITPPQPLGTQYQLLLPAACPPQHHQLCLRLPLVHREDIAVIQHRHLQHTMHLLREHLAGMAVLETPGGQEVVITRGPRLQREAVIAVRKHRGRGVAVMTMENRDIRPLVHSENTLVLSSN